MNTRGMMTLGFDNNDLANGITLSSLFMPEDLERLMSELSGLTSPGQITLMSMSRKQAEKESDGTLSRRSDYHQEQGNRLQVCPD